MKAYERMGMKIHTNDVGQIAKMAAIPICGKNLKMSSFPEPIDSWPSSTEYSSTTKIVQIMILRTFLRKGQNWKVANIYDFNERFKDFRQQMVI